LERLSLEVNSDDFVFDNQMLSQILWLGYRVAEMSCPTKYFPEASSINLYRSINKLSGNRPTELGANIRPRLIKRSHLGWNPTIGNYLGL
jgi:hypothetical protein